MKSVPTGPAGTEPLTGSSLSPSAHSGPLPEEAEHALLLLSAIVESSDDAIVSKDLNGIVTSWNKSAERMFGYTTDEMVGQSITLIIPPELRDEETRILAKLRAGERIDHFQTVRTHKNGSLLDVSLTISPIRDRQGNIVGAAKIVHDITLQKQREHASVLLAAIVESSDDAIVSKNLNGIVTSWNRGAERIFGYNAAEMVGRSITTIIPPELRDEETRILAKLRAGERIDHFQTVRVHKDGNLLDVSLTISPIRDEYGNIVGAAKIVRDITQQKKLEASLHASEKLISAGRLAATIAHEINNPLQAVTNFIYLARQDGDLSENTKSNLDIADRELVRIAHVAQQTLGFYRDNSLAVWLAVSDVIEDVLAIYESKFTAKGLQIERQIEPGLTTYTLQGELKQILLNLMVNAIDASEPGGRIVVRARASRHFQSGRRGIRITIGDTGVGIAGDAKAKVFVPFFTTKKEMGTGLGLWITKDLLERKGGHIRLHSRDRKPSGTVISVFLPLNSAIAA